MSVYVYRLTTKTVATSNGQVANVTECLGSGPSYRAADRYHAAFDRKIAVGAKRAKTTPLTGFYAEDDMDGSPVYVGKPTAYPDSRDYEVARDENGNEITVVNPRKPRPQHWVDQGLYD